VGEQLLGDLPLAEFGVGQSSTRSLGPSRSTATALAPIYLEVAAVVTTAILAGR